MRTNTKKYHVLKAIAECDGPATCKEIYDQMPPEYQPSESGAKDDWEGVTGPAARLYGDHLVDRRKRDAHYKPMEYWLAAKGRQILQDEGDLPENPNDSAPVPENTGDPSQRAEQVAPEGGTTVTCEDCGRTLDVPEGVNPGQVMGGHQSHCDGEDRWTEQEADEQEAPTADVDAIRADLGLDDPEVDTGEALASALTGIVSTIRGLEQAVDTLRGSAVTEDEVEDRLENTVHQSVMDRVDTLQKQVAALAKNQSEKDGLGTEFGPYIQRLRALERQGYGLYEGDISTEYGGNVQEVRVKAKPRAKTDKKGPDGTDDAKMGAEDAGSDDVTPGANAERTVVQKGDSDA